MNLNAGRNIFNGVNKLLAVRDRTHEIFADAEFKDLTKKTFGGYAQAFGADAKQVVRNAVGMPPETKEWLLNWIDSNLRTGA